MAEAGRNRWLEYDPAHDWLPEPHATSGPCDGTASSRTARENTPP